MFDPNEQHTLMAEQKQKLLRQARLHQLYSQSERDRPHFGLRVMTLLGDLMISGGHKLKAHAQAPAQLNVQNS